MFFIVPDWLMYKQHSSWRKRQRLPFSAKKVSSLSILKYDCCQRINLSLESECGLDHLLEIEGKPGRELMVQGEGGG